MQMTAAVTALDVLWILTLAGLAVYAATLPVPGRTWAVVLIGLWAALLLLGAMGVAGFGLVAGFTVALTFGTLLGLLQRWIRAGRWVPVVLLSLSVLVLVGERLLAPDDSNEIAETIETYYGSDDPTVCGSLTTQRFLEQTMGVTMPAALAVCESEIAYGPGPVGTVNDIEVTQHDAERATARIQFAGTAFGDASTEVRLVSDTGQWRLHEILTADVDPAQFRDSYADYLAADPGGYSARLSGCTADRLDRLSEDRLEQLLLERGEGGRLVITAMLRCDRAELVTSVIESLRRPGDEAGDAGGCVEDRLRRASDTRLLELVGSNPVPLTLLQIRCDREAYIAGYGELIGVNGGLEEEGRCLLSRLRGLSDRELAATMWDPAGLDRLAEGC